MPANLDQLGLDSLVKKEKIIVFKDVIKEIDFLKEFLELIQNNYLLYRQTKPRIGEVQKVTIKIIYQGL